jgi:Transcriptional regulator
VARPKEALISREAVLDVALEIMKTEGIDALSIRRIAKELGVNGASLYHHFKNKGDIINGAAELALMRTPLHPLPPSATPHSWEESFLAGTWQLCNFLIAHPPLIPAFPQRRAAGLANKFLEGGIHRLINAGMPLPIIMPLSEALETLAIGWALRQTAGGSTPHNDDLSDLYPLLFQAAQKRFMTYDAVFEEAATSIIQSFKARYASADQSK